MGKAIIYLAVFLSFIFLVSAVNYDWLYNPYTAKRDRSIKLNQSGNNFTADCFGNGTDCFTVTELITGSGGGTTYNSDEDWIYEVANVFYWNESKAYLVFYNESEIDAFFVSVRNSIVTNISEENTTMTNYVDAEITSARDSIGTNISTENTTMSAYVDAEVTSARNSITTNISTENTTMKEYVDANDHGNGANCNAGEYALGVDEDGVVESCTDAGVEILAANGSVVAFVNSLGGHTNLTYEEIADNLGNFSDYDTNWINDTINLSNNTMRDHVEVIKLSIGTNITEDNESMKAYVDETKVNNTGSVMTGDLLGTSFNGSFNWTTTDDWSTFNGYIFDFNETKLSTIYYNATHSILVAGTIDSGTLVDTQHSDGNYDSITFNFTEEAGSPGLDLRMNFTNVDDLNQGVMRYKTSALSGDFAIIQLWDYNIGDWDDYPSVGESLSFATITQPVFDSDSHILGGVVQMRVYKASNGNTNNHYYVDWVSISQSYGTPSGREIDPFWLQDKPDYYNITQTDTMIVGNMTEENESMTAYVDALNTSVTNYTDAEILSVRGSIVANITEENLTMKAYVDANIGGADTNETFRVDNIVYNNCTADDFVTGWMINGTPICGTPTGGGGGTGDKWIDNGTFISPNGSFAENIFIRGYVKAYDWTNVTIGESQITDLSHTVDTNFSTICGNDEVGLGQGNCIDLNDTIDDRDSDTTYNAEEGWIYELSNVFYWNFTLATSVFFNKTEVIDQNTTMTNYVDAGDHGNGLNCNAGEYPLGVDEVGAVEMCTDAGVEILAANSSVVAYLDSEITSVRSSIDTNISTENTTMSAYVDAEVTSARASIGTNITSENTTMSAYVDAEITSARGSITTNISLENTTMKAYVDSVSSLFVYANYFDQSLNQSSAPTFATVDTGFGANELYDMNQHVQTTDEVIFGSVNSTGSLNFTNQDINTVKCIYLDNGAKIGPASC